MAELMRAHDWAATPLGTPDTWPESLRTACRICLRSRLPMALCWGPGLGMLYNDAYIPVLGDKHPAIGTPAAHAWPELWPVIGSTVDSVLAGDPTLRTDQLLPMVRHGYWEEAYFTFSYSPLHAEDGSVAGLFAALTETTERVLGERRLRTLRALGELSTATAGTVEAALSAALEVLAENRADVPHALAYTVDEDGNAARRVDSFGIRSADEFFPAVLPDPHCGATIWRVASTGDAELVTGLRERYPGIFPAETTTVGDLPPDQGLVLPVTVPGRDRPVGVLVAGVSAARALNEDYRSFFDLVARQVSVAVTDVLAYQAERKRAESLAELDRAKNEFFANISHEFRTPLTLIAGPTEEALAEPDQSPAQRDRWRVVARNADRLRRLVDDMLDFARIEAGRLRPEPAPVDLAAFTGEVVASFAPAVARAGLALRVHCPPLPGPVAVDPEMWEKVLLNLLSNAVKFTLDGTIEVRQEPRGDWVELTVADSGIGIPADELPLLFQRFHRISGSGGRSHEGAGIGLALVSELVRLHDGTVAVESGEGEGEGSTFTVRLPHRAPHATVATPTLRTGGSVPPPEADDTGEIPAAGRTEADEPLVLVVEDNADLRRLVTRLLLPRWRVLQAGDGEAGLRLAREHRPDLILSDVMMPRLDGFALLRTLRADPVTATIPVVLLSARAGEEAALEGLDAGADDYLPKPFSARELVARVRSHLELARLRRGESEFRRALVESLQEGLFVFDSEGGMLEMNDALAEMLGYPADQAPYPYPQPWIVDAEQNPDGRALTDATLATILAEGRGRAVIPARHRDGHPLWLAISATTTSAPGCTQVYVCTVRDVTGERAAAEREATVAGYAAALAAATDVTEVLDAGLSGLRGAFGASRVVAALWPNGYADPTLTGQPTAGSWAELDAVAAAALRTARARSPMPGGVPPEVPGLATTLDGDMAIWLDLAGRPASTPDRTLFGLLTDQLGQALVRARDYDRARQVALTLQHAILGPTQLPAGFAVRYEPAVQPLEVGGDWYDVVTLPDGRIAVVVGDCVGRGLAAASVMGQLRSACQALLLRAGGPAQVLTELDAFATRLPDASCTTVFCAIIDPGNATVRYSCAGHLPAVLVAPGAEPTLLDEARSLPLAIAPDRPRIQASTSMPPGATLLLYTDGLIERRSAPLDTGIDVAARFLLDHEDLRLDELADRLMDGLRPRGGYDDDVAVLLYRSPPAPLYLEVPAEPRRLSGMRRELRRWLAASSFSADDADDTVLAVGEAAANSIEHGCNSDTTHRVTVAAALTDGHLDVRVSDTGSWRPPNDVPGARSHRGRGLIIMRSLTDEMTIEPGHSGTTVWMRKVTR